MLVHLLLALAQNRVKLEGLGSVWRVRIVQGERRRCCNDELPHRLTEHKAMRARDHGNEGCLGGGHIQDVVRDDEHVGVRLEREA